MAAQHLPMRKPWQHSSNERRKPSKSKRRRQKQQPQQVQRMIRRERRRKARVVAWVVPLHPPNMTIVAKDSTGQALFISNMPKSSEFVSRFIASLEHIPRDKGYHHYKKAQNLRWGSVLICDRKNIQTQFQTHTKNQLASVLFESSDS